MKTKSKMKIIYPLSGAFLVGLLILFLVKTTGVAAVINYSFGRDDNDNFIIKAQNTPTPIMIIDSTGAISKGQIPASLVSAADFGSSTGGGTYSFSGNVGIGTAVPAARLNLLYNAIGSTQSDAYGLTLYNTTAATESQVQYSPPLVWRGYSWDSAIAGESKSIDFRAYVAPRTPGIMQAASGSLVFEYSVNGAAYSTNLAMQSGGNIGIGTTLPTYTLDVVGTGNFSSALSTGSNLIVNGNTTIGSGTEDSVTVGADAVTISNDTNVTLSGGVNGLAFDTSTLSIDATNHRIGIGTTAPTDYLDISGGGIHLATSGQTLDLASDTDGNTFILEIPQKATNGTCASGNAEGLIIKESGGTQVGHICIMGPSSIQPNTLKFFASAFTTASTDLAENYSDIKDNLEAGDLVVVDKLLTKSAKKSFVPYDSSILGIISNNPGLHLTDIDESGKTSLINPKPVALQGRVPLKVSTENGSITIGDALTSSSIPGVAMKATKAGSIVGKALESYSNTDPNRVGKILTYVNVSWHDPNPDELSKKIEQQQQEIEELKATVEELKNK